MSDELSRQLQDLATWVDQRWEAHDPAVLRAAPSVDADDLAPMPDPATDADQRGRGTPPAGRTTTNRALAIAACLVILAAFATVALQHRDAGMTSTGPGASAWTPAASYSFTDRTVAEGAPALWTGHEVLLMGALTQRIDGAGTTSAAPVLETPAYDPSTDTWRTLPAPPTVESGPLQAVWTGTEAITFASPRFTNPTVAAPCDPVPATNGPITVMGLNPVNSEWRSRAAPPDGSAPVHSAFWTGRTVIVVLADGCVLTYDPQADRYSRPASPPDVRAAQPTPATDPNRSTSSLRHLQSAVWTGTEIIETFADGADIYAFDPVTGVTRRLPASPLGIELNSGVAWTGTSLVALSMNADRAATLDPATSTWRVLPPSPLSSRGLTEATRAGDQVVFWGGEHPDVGQGTVSANWFGDGAAYDPTLDGWTPIPPWPGPGFGSSAADAGDRLFVWSGGNAKGSANGTIVAATFSWPR